ncbi:MAG TPA: HAMP domain-containing sensor histidine kinase [Chloroflexota bacterium]|nr:HAMP domain-containing sensor histidine kinase [Chloroflexota bacterium]
MSVVARLARLGTAARGMAARLSGAQAGPRLQTKLALFGGALVLAGVGLTGAAGLWLIDRQAERAARVRLAAALEFAVAEYEGLVENAHITAEVLAARLSPQFLQPAQGELSPEEVSALVALVRGPRRVEAADSIAIIGRDAAVLVEVVRDRGATRGGQWPGDEAVATALGGAPALGVEVFPGGGLRAVAVLPVFGAAPAPANSPGGAHAAESPSPVGAVAVTSFLDDDAAARVKRVTGFDVAFFAGERSLVASSRGADSIGAMALLEQLAHAWSVVGAGEEAEADTGGPLQRVLTRFAPLRDTTGDVIGAVAVSAEIDVLGAGRRQTLALFAAAASVVLALTLVTDAYAARALSEPLARLVASVRRIGAGDLATPVPGPKARATDVGRDEVGELAASVEEMRRRLAAAAESQAQLARLKDEYLFSVAHELRSPLAALAASVEVLAESADDLAAGERVRFVGIVARHTAALRGLVDNLLDLGSLRAGRFRVEPLPTLVDVVLEEAIEDVRLLLEARRQRVVQRVASPAPVALADPRRLRQVLVNLLSNAAKYGPEGEVVEVSAEQRVGMVRLVVADRGPGIPAEERSRLFDAYFRSESTSRAAPGVGLGLAIVRAIVDAHGGRVGVEGRRGEGTRFWVELPAAFQDGQDHAMHAGRP